MALARDWPQGTLMILCLGALQDALLSAGAEPEKERKAASIDTRLAVLTWIAGTNPVMTTAILGRVFS